GSWGSLCWSPGGANIVSTNSYLHETKLAKFVSVDVHTGETRILPTPPDTVFRSPRFVNRGPVILAVSAIMQGGQVWSIPNPEGTPKQLTNDLNTYVRLTIARDGAKVLA